MRRYKTVIVDEFEHPLHLRIREMGAHIWKPVIDKVSNPLRRATWIWVTRRVELAMGDDFMSYYPRLGTKYPLLSPGKKRSLMARN